MIRASAAVSVPRPATIRQVARKARVSPATVSRLFNHPGMLDPATATRVRRAASALNFRPSRVGRNLRTESTRTLGVLVPTLSNPVFAECLDGIVAAARDRGYSILVETSEYRAEAEHATTEALLGHRVDGLILTVADARRNPALAKLERERVPYVLVYNQVPGGRRPTVSVDNRAAARDAVRMLIEAGHRRIAMVSGSFRASDRAQLRYLGYRDAMAVARLASAEPVEVPFDIDDARPALAAVLARRSTPTALFCSNDLLALVVMRDLARLGRTVPDDVSLVGFDGIRLSEVLRPALTTVVQPSRAIGRAAAERLLGQLAGAARPAPLLLPHRLRAGGTVAPPRTGSRKS